MEISKIFNNYIELGTMNEYPTIEEFNFIKGSKVYINKIKTEMFIIINAYLIKDNINELCENIENSIMGFINFGEGYRESIEYLKYNITVIFIVNSENQNKPNEKSTRICRKIYVYGKNEKGEEIDDEDVNYFPFYLENLKEVNNKKINELENELIKLRKSAYELLIGEENNNA